MPLLRVARTGVIVVGALALSVLRVDAKSFGLDEMSARHLTSAASLATGVTTELDAQAQEDLLNGDYGSNVTVPEPATLLLVGIGLCAVGRLRRRPRHLNMR